MTRNDFAILCGELLIDPAIALESEAVRTALKRRCTADELRKIMSKEF